MLDTACEILERAATHHEHPGYYRIYIDRLAADLYQIRGSIEYELDQPGHGMSWLTTSKRRRQLVVENEQSSQDDRYELAVTNANIALAMMADNQAQKALPWIEELLNYPAEYVSRDIWTANLSNLFWLLGDYQKSLATSQESFELTAKAHGVNSLRMATYVYISKALVTDRELTICLRDSIHFNTGNAHLSLGQTDEAFESFSACLRICLSEMPHHYKTGFTYHKLGVIMMGSGDFESSA
jgi:tetratricopeptide (TPR) repeat protein